MIELTRLNGSVMMLNSDLIKTAEASPDTMLTLVNGEKLIVREEIAEVVERIVAYRARLLANVARRAPSGELDRIAGLTSLDPDGQSGQSAHSAHSGHSGHSGPHPLTKSGPKREPERDSQHDR